MLVLCTELVAYILHYLTIKRLFIIKKSLPAKFVRLFISILLIGMVIYIGDWGNLPPTFVLYLAGIQYACEGSRIKKLTLALMLASTVFAWNALLDNIVPAHDHWQTIPFRILFSILLYLIMRFRGPDAETELGKSLWRLMLFLTLPPTGIVLSIVLVPENRVAEQRWILLLYTVLLLLVLFSLVGLLWAIAVLSKHRKLEQQNFYAEMNRKYYESMKQQHFEIRRLKHDLSNHLHAISLLPAGEKEAYIADLLESPALLQRMNYCGDDTVNAVLSVKEQLMRQQNIALSLKLDIPEMLPFDNADICVLFANALDNAIESCLAFPEKQRYIELTARHQKGMLALSIKNPASLSIEAGHLPSTTKPDAEHHGYGLRSMEEIVNHYKGDLKIKALDGVFELFLYLPEPGRGV